MSIHIEKVISLEIKLLDPMVRKNDGALRALLAPQFKEVTPSGEIWSREQIIAALTLEEKPIPYFATNFESSLISEDIIILTYHLSKESVNLPHSVRSSIWKRVGNQWQMFFHQGTLLKN